MDGLRDLYQEVIFDHNRHPRNQGRLDQANRKAEGFNPLCGDEVTLYLRVDERGVITDVRFDGHGCAISTASASILTEVLKGKTEAEADALFARFHDVVTGRSEDEEGLGKLSVLAGVRGYPARVKCATLAWHTMQAALRQAQEPVSTE